eukprot:CAMPEP_0119217734 /NCGR_PEP_ID=MMETSP1327-20130426/18893_1 /TAXON_ID=38833 /ORGANISM="Micromonas pusilla, Strain RCC2306" /LENGTH=38 /DNA_ID= /DNA_START= /DNA_END= /DNA_ORIENTATION=
MELWYVLFASAISAWSTREDPAATNASITAAATACAPE